MTSKEITHNAEGRLKFGLGRVENIVVKGGNT